MTALTAAALVLWFGLTAASVLVWLPDRGSPTPRFARARSLLAVVALEVGLSATVAWLAAVGGPAPPPWSWLAVGVGSLAALLTGGAVTFATLALADASSRPSAARVQRTVLRGGAWIGGLERLALFGTLVAGWPEGIVAIVAVKAFARYPELKTGQATGAIERFIIGTFTSLGWAAGCAGIAMVFLP